MMAEKSALQTAKIAELKRRIAADPASRSFLELAREYHEAGLFEEAAAVCSQGLKYHPHYVSARVLLGRVWFDSGLLDESRGEMETVLAAVPDNLVARRVVAEVLKIQGDLAGALERFRALLAFNPGDQETKNRILEIDALMNAPAPAAAPEVAAAPTAAPAPAAAAPVEQAPEPDVAPLATPTLAEIYLQQGLVHKAIAVYHEILEGDPGNLEAISRLSELEPKPLPSPDPGMTLVTRKIEVLSGWLDAIRGRARA